MNLTSLDLTSNEIEGAFARSQNWLPRILILGGTGEGAELASRLAKRLDLRTISSMAGRVNEPKLPVGIVKIGGFGGIDGLASYLVEENIRLVVDATHPFATRISNNAELACARLGLPLIAFLRPPWLRAKEDVWYEVDSFKEAADIVDSRKGRIFLSIGRQEVNCFANCNNAWFLIRAIQELTGQIPRHHEVILRRGPFSLDDELLLLRSHSVNYVVSKNSGGLATYTKICAARILQIPVVMVKRPVKYTVPVVETLDEIISEIDRAIYPRSLK